MIANAIRDKERLNKEFMAELVLFGKSYAATIENLSETGIKVRAATDDTKVHFFPHAILDLRFESPAGESFSLSCRVVWTSKNAANSLITDIGLEITEESPLYQDFYKAISMDGMLLLWDHCNH